MNEETETASTQQTPLSHYPSESSHPLSMSPLPEGLQRALTTLVAHLSTLSFLRVETAYSNALRACRGPQSFALSRATVDRYLELTAGLYEEHSATIESFTPSFCVSWLNGTEREAMLISMTTCGAEHFARLLRDCLRRGEDVQYALRAALRDGRVLYVKWFCTIACDFPELAQIIVDVVWSVRHDQLHMLLRHCACCTFLPSGVVWRYLTKTMSDTASWMGPDPDYDMGPLVTWVLWNFTQFRHLDLGLLGLGMTPRQKELLPDFANFCMHRRASVVAIFMAAMVKDWPLVLAVLGRRPEELHHPSFPLSDLVLFMHNKAPLDLVVESMLAVIDRSAVSTLRFEPHVLLTSELHAMSSMCRAGGRPKWAIFFLLHTEKRRDVLPLLTSCTDRDTMDLVLITAARYNLWSLVEALLPFTSNDATFLIYVFQRVAKNCLVDLVKRLLPRVDLALLPFVHGAEDEPTATFITLVNFTPWTDLINRVRMVLLLVREGLASHCRHGERVVKSAIRMRMPIVARLLLDVGMVSKEQFRQILRQGYIRQVLRTQLDLRQAVDRAVEDARLDCPRTLQDSCRLVVSHQAGFGRGRQQRIEQLPLPRTLRRFVALSDLCERAEAMAEQGLDATGCF